MGAGDRLPRRHVHDLGLLWILLSHGHRIDSLKVTILVRRRFCGGADFWFVGGYFAGGYIDSRDDPKLYS